MKLYKSITGTMMINGTAVVFKLTFAEPLSLTELGGSLPQLSITVDSKEPLGFFEFK